MKDSFMQSEVEQKHTVSRISIKDHALIINDFVCTDNDVVQYFEALEPRKMYDAIGNSLKIGVSAFRLQNVMNPVGYMERRFDRIEQSLDSQIEKTRQSILENVEAQFGTNGIISSLLDPNSKDGPLFRLKQDIHGWIMQLTATIASEKSTAMIRKSTTAKGLDFEKYVDHELGEIIKLSKGDQYLDVSLTPGLLTNNKKGDRIITVQEANNTQIAVEMKDVQRLSITDIHNIASQSLKNREAALMLLIVRCKSALPSSIGWINEYGDHLVVALSSEDEEGNVEVHRELLAMAYHLAKVRLLSIVKKDTLTYDSKLLAEKIENIRRSINELGKVSTHLTNARNQLSSIETIATAVRTNIEREMTSLNCVLQTESIHSTESAKIGLGRGDA